MEPYFVWNGVDSRQKGLWVLSYPPITKPPQRFQQVTIPGRPGTLTLLEGDDIYDQYVRELKIMPKPHVSMSSILSWLSGPGVVTFGHEPFRQQRAMVMEQFDLIHEFAGQRSATVRFLCEPFKSDIFKATYHTVDLTQESFMLQGDGDVKSYPTLLVTASGTVTVTVNGVDLAINDLSGETAHVDCSSRTTYTVQQTDDGTVNVPVTTHGDYFSLNPHGENVITWTEGVTALTVYPEWRWL